MSTIRYRDATEAKQYHDEALSVLRRLSRTKRLANALHAAGSMCKEAVDLPAAQALFEEARTLSRALGDGRLHDTCEAQLADIAFLTGQMAEAINRARGAVDASRPHCTLTAEWDGGRPTTLPLWTHTRSPATR